jgi:hypothetical protein
MWRRRAFDQHSANHEIRVVYSLFEGAVRRIGGSQSTTEAFRQASEYAQVAIEDRD